MNSNEERTPVDDAVQKFRVIHRAEVAVDALLFREARPKDYTELCEQRIPVTVPRRNHRINFAFDPLAEHSVQGRLELKTFIEQCESTLTQGVLDGLGNKLRADRPQVQF